MKIAPKHELLLAAALALLVVATPGSAPRAFDFPYEPALGYPSAGTYSVTTTKSFGALVESLDAAVKANGMLVVMRASASIGASKRGITIPGNMVVGVFRNDFAVRMLEASVPAGIEAPLRFYVTEEGDGTATLTFRKPSAVFAPYGSAALDAMAAELDGIWARIVDQAIK